MNRVPGRTGAQKDWPGLIGAVASALAGQPGSRETGPLYPHSLLTAVTGTIPPGLRRRLLRQATDPEAAGRQVEPAIYQNELPVSLLASGIVGIAAEAVAAWHQDLTSIPGAADHLPEADRPDARVLAIVAISALSTLRLDLIDPDAALAWVHRRLAEFGEPAWAEALSSLASRTRQLHDLLRAARSTRRQQWHQVTVEDRILGEAAAAAVVGGAAAASGVPPERWLFPFHLFCKLAVTAAEDALSAIERWLGVDFLPAPRTAERSASLAVLTAEQAASLWQGCACKSGPSASDLAFSPRGHCRQPDHDLSSWQPGGPKPGSRAGSRYTVTLWGWLRRWLGGNGGGRTEDSQPGSGRLLSNEVAGSVLARKWLCTDRGSGGPVLLYDRILPEFCLACGNKVELASYLTPAGHAQVKRTCCGEPRRVYRSGFSERNGRQLPRPKLGIVIVWPPGAPHHAGYCSTRPLGPLWLCRASGRYSRSQWYCPACGRDPGPGHERVPYGWVLLPREEAWQNLKDTGRYDSLASGPATVSEADLRWLEQIFAQLCPGISPAFAGPADTWTAAQQLSMAQTRQFIGLAGQRGLELLLRCQEIARDSGNSLDDQVPGPR